MWCLPMRAELAAFSAAMMFMACLNGGEGERAYFRLEADPVLLTYERVTIRLADTSGRVRATLYDDSLPSLAKLSRLPAGAYRGETVLISILAYRDGRLAYRETRTYDGRAGKALAVEISLEDAPETAGPEAGSGSDPAPVPLPGSATVAKPAPTLVFRQGDTLVSIRDSVILDLDAADSDGDLAGYSWDCGGDGNAQGTSSISGRHAKIRLGLRFMDPGLRICVVSAWNRNGGAIRKEARVQVELDPPWADAGNDTTVAAGAAILLHARGEDGFGPIVSREWNIGDVGFVAVPRQETSIVAPSGPGPLMCILRVMDSDSLFALDTMMVTVVPLTPP